jgi:hypothetical protein
MGRRKRVTRKIHKKKGGDLWTPNKNLTVKRRQNLLTYTSNLTQKSNNAREALNQYLANVQEEESSKGMITAADVLDAITPSKIPSDLGWYVNYAVRNCENLIIAATFASMRQKKQIDVDRRLSKKATFLANRAATRVQQAAHIASIGRLSNSPIDRNAQAELEAWNKSALQRGLDQQKNIEEAERIFKNNTTIQAEQARIYYEFAKQVAENIEKLDQIIVLHKKIQSNGATLGAYYTSNKRERDKASIVPTARERIVKQIPLLGGTAFVDRALPKLMEEIMILLVNASAEHVKKMKGSALDIAMARNQDFSIQEKQLTLVRLHFDILVSHDSRLRGELAKNPLLDIKKYTDVMAKLNESIQEVIRLKKNPINSASGPQSR